MRYLRFFIILLLIFSADTVSAQNQHKEKDEGKPEIGLVLSGGAAKGFAHAGVIEVLEEVGIRPDYITGTSMGAIVGGLYSLGYSADEMKKLTSEIDWDKILTDRVPLNKIVMEEKDQFERYLLELPIHDYKFKLPSGLTEGYQLERLFTELFWGATDIHDFDNLPIPFHCMSLDIVEGKTIEFSSGHLPTAIRSSMAIPGVFAPIRIDSMLLVDGGITRNLPVQEVIDMGADIVIAVYVGFEGDVTPEDLFSLSSILTRTTIFLGVMDSKQQMKLADFLVLPDMKGISSTDFFSGDSIIERGRIAAEKMKPRLQKLADSLNLSYEPVEKPEGPEFIYITDVDVENLRYVRESFVIGQGDIFPGTYTNKEKLDKAVERLYGTRYFNKVGYRLEHIEDMKYRLVYMTKESTRAHLKVAPYYSNQLGTGIVLNSTFRNYIIPSSRITLTANIAENPGIRFDVNKYLGKEQKYIGHHFTNWNQTKLPVFYQNENVGNYTHGLFQTGLGAKYSLSFNQQIGLDLYYERNSVKPGGAVKTFFPDADFENYVFGGFSLKTYYNLNTLNDLFFATRGTKLNVELKRVMSPLSTYRIEESNSLEGEIFNLDLQPFNTFYIDYEKYFNVTENLSLSFGTSMGLTSIQTPITNNFALGGMMYLDKYNYETFYGLTFGEQIVPNFWKIKGTMNYQLFSRFHLTAAGNIAFPEMEVTEFLTSLKKAGWNDYLKGYAAGLRIDSPLGPIVLMAGDLASDARTRWYVSLGYTF